MKKLGRALRYALVAVALAGITGGGVWWWKHRSPLARAQTAYASGQFERALAEVAIALKEAPHEEVAIALAGRCLYRLARFRDAEESCYRWLPLQAQSEEDLRLRAEGLILRRDWEPALAVCKELHGRRPAEPRVLQRLSVVAFQVGQLELAQESADKLLAFADHAAAAWCLLGVIAEARDRTAEAIECLTKVMELDPAGESLPILPEKVAWKLAVNLRQQGELDRARIVLENLAERAPSPELDCELAEVYFALGRIDPARERWRKALDRQPHSAPALVGLGRVALLQDRPAEALARFQAAAKAGGVWRELHHLLSQAYARTGNLELAAVHAKEAERVRQADANRNTTDLLILQQADSLAARVLLAQRALESANYAEAESLVHELRRQAPLDPRVQALWEQWQTAQRVPRPPR